MSTSAILPLRVPIGLHPSKQRPIACRRRRTPIASDLMYGRASDACLVSYDDTYILSGLYFFPVPVFYNISYSYIALAHSDLRTYSTLCYLEIGVVTQMTEQAYLRYRGMSIHVQPTTQSIRPSVAERIPLPFINLVNNCNVHGR
jgi:hypothetical protein